MYPPNSLENDSPSVIYKGDGITVAKRAITAHTRYGNEAVYLVADIRSVNIERIRPKWWALGFIILFSTIAGKLDPDIKHPIIFWGITMPIVLSCGAFYYLDYWAFGARVVIQTSSGRVKLPSFYNPWPWTHIGENEAGKLYMAIVNVLIGQELRPD